MISQEWIKDPSLQSVLETLNCDGHVAFLVGGCVRNALLELPITDIDIATNLDPKNVTSLAKQAGFEVVPTGIEHGTVTILTSTGPFEVTTFRQDIETDGRHATVSFTSDIKKDASRRDFTMNALYSSASGQVIDPLNGLDDLRKRHVRFIGDPKARIREDHLRILRFFRFTAIYGDPSLGLDREGLAACACLQSGIEEISKERIGSEMLKLLSAPDPSPAIASMAQTGLLARILSGADPRLLPILVHLEGDRKPDPIRRLAVLGGFDHQNALRLSNKQSDQLKILLEDIDPSGIRVAQYHGEEAGLNAALIAAAFSENALPKDIESNVCKAANAKFPLAAQDLMSFVTGANLGQALRSLKSYWISENFEPTKNELIARFHRAQEGKGDD